jgi:hemerythrin-like domain-containing protein
MEYWGSALRPFITPLFQHSNTPAFSSMRHPSLIALSHDHHHGLALALRCRKQSLGQIKPLGAEGLKARAKELQEFFFGNLVQHFRAEEEVLFPLMLSFVPDSHSLIDELRADHERIRSMRLRLEKEQGLGKLIFDLGDLLERHIRKEERELFRLFEENVPSADAQVTGEKIKEILGQERTVSG